MKRAAALAASLASLACAAQENAHPWELRLEGAYENLDHGQPDWQEALAQLAWKPHKGLTLLGGAHATERFDQHDREGWAAAYLPLGDKGTILHLETTLSSTHKVLARNSALAELAQPLGAGWVVTGGAKYSHYDTGDVTIASGTVEKYLGDYRLAYTVYISRLEGAGWTPAHRIAASWYRGELTYVTLSAAKGREVENVFPQPLLVTDVSAASIAGGLEITPAWGLTLEALYVRQGDLYTRRGARLGTRILF
jgi:YaiO family outer membrane protein